MEGIDTKVSYQHPGMNKKFKERTIGLLRRTRDIETALALPQTKGIARFRSIARTVLSQISDCHRRNTWAYLKDRKTSRDLYASLVAKQLQCAELQTVWKVKASLTAKEADDLENVSRELRPGDWDYYQSLAQKMHRGSWVHAYVSFITPRQASVME